MSHVVLFNNTFFSLICALLLPFFFLIDDGMHKYPFAYFCFFFLALMFWPISDLFGRNLLRPVLQFSYLSQHFILYLRINTHYPPLTSPLNEFEENIYKHYHGLEFRRTRSIRFISDCKNFLFVICYFFFFTITALLLSCNLFYEFILINNNNKVELLYSILTYLHTFSHFYLKITAKDSSMNTEIQLHFFLFEYFLLDFFACFRG